MSVSVSKEIFYHKTHTCIHCGSIFSYVMKRTPHGMANSEEEAVKAFEANVIQAATGVDNHPCPNCGVVQPEMVAAKRKKHYIWQMIIFTCLFLITVLIAYFHVIHYTTAVLIHFCGAFSIVIWHLITNIHNPNNNLVAQRKIAKQREQHPAQLKLEKQGNLEGDIPPNEITHIYSGFLSALCALSLLFIITPEVVRTTKKWPLNPQWYPQIIGPNDTSRYYFKKAIYSIKGYWRGIAVANIFMEGQSFDAKATTNNNSWEQTISFESSERDTKSHIYAQVTMPSQSQLQNKEVLTVVYIEYKYPKFMGGNTYMIRDGQVEEKTSVKLAHANAGRQYLQLFYGGNVGGGLLLLLLLFVAHQRNKKFLTSTSQATILG
ncbi:hypothetical protein [Candidatus Uabimicrobium amorphum]|uniref:Uncharacterized protein n=1 Tax=Uabimicrobium amorphum TaxID=2596890 RepID=A0A5S9IJI9_UABAM|nr:hypothetical protein [Candidatus Uabimicrobium amorphum]BBM82874.1 hypothetical protein UABAM_01217 [Candidatus Uabimicrobium amorphum]